MLLSKQKVELYEQTERCDETTLADALEYVKVEVQRLKNEKEDLLKNLQKANSVACELQNKINNKKRGRYGYASH